MPRLPVLSDFAGAVVGITPAPDSSQPPANVLILLHGFGDSEEPFTQLGQRLNLPATCVIAVRAVAPLPFMAGGFHWGDDITMDPKAGGAEINYNAGFKRSTDFLLNTVVRKGLIDGCGFTCRQIIFWGVGQGAMAALSAGEAAEPAVSSSPALQKAGSDDGASSKTSLLEFGGIISAGGPLPENISARLRNERKCRAPVLVVGGLNSTQVPDDQINRIKRVFEFVESVKWRRSGDGMPQNRDEMMPVMQFLSRRLLTTAPQGFTEL